MHFNPPPNWPLDDDFEPGPGWQPDPAWGPAPYGWSLWINDEGLAAGSRPAPGPPVVNVTVQQKRGGCAGCLSFIVVAFLVLLVIGGIAKLFGAH